MPEEEELYILYIYILVAELALIYTCYCKLSCRSSCEDHHDYCENSFWDLHTIVAIQNDTAVAFRLALPFPVCTHTACDCELPGYGNINPADPVASSLLV